MMKPILAAVLSLGLAAGARAQFVNGQAAVNVIGQADLSTKASNVVGTPSGVAIDAKTGKIFVCDMANNRVLRFASTAAFQNGAAPESVLGQPNLGTYSATTSQTGMSNPNGIALDAKGHLWVVDRGNNRVLRFDQAVTLANGAPANGVLGQSNFDTSTAGLSDKELDYPTAVAVAANGDLWVSEFDNNRVLKFTNATGKGNGDAANVVLGQPDFTTKAFGGGATGFTRPNGLFVDATGSLWVADQFNSRVLRFDNAASLSNGAAANGVLGQPDFTTYGAQTTQNGFNHAFSVEVDSAGRLYVTDLFNHRVMIFSSAAKKTNGAAADFVLGQANFTQGSSGLSATALSLPEATAYLKGVGLLVADSQNSRVIRYANIFGTPAVKATPGKTTLPAGKSKTLRFVLSNTSQSADTFTVSGKIPKLPGVRIQFFLGSKNITAKVSKGYTLPEPLAAGAKTTITAKVRTSAAAAKTVSLKLTFTSANDSSARAVATAKVKIR